MPGLGETLTTKAGPLPVWAWAGGGTVVLTLILYANKKKKAAAAAQQQQSANAVQSNLGTIPLSNLTQQAAPMPIQMGDTFVSVTNPAESDNVSVPVTINNPPAPQPMVQPPPPVQLPPPAPAPPKPTTEEIRIVPLQTQMTAQDWANLAALPQNVKTYLQNLAAQIQRTGGWTSVPYGFQGLPPNTTLQASGPGWATVILPGSSTSTTIPIPYTGPGSIPQNGLTAQPGQNSSIMTEIATMGQ